MKSKTLIIGLVVLVAFAGLVYSAMKNDSKEAMMDKAMDEKMMEEEEMDMMEEGNTSIEAGAAMELESKMMDDSEMMEEEHDMMDTEMEGELHSM